jgi:hypothetical protein
MRDGLLAGFFVWLGFVATTVSVNYALQMRPVELALIDGGHWVMVLLIMGAVIGAFGT